MDTLLLFLADFFERLGASLRASAASGDLFGLLDLVPLAGASVVAVAGLRQIWRWVFRVDSRAREEKRAAERACKDAQDELVEANARIDELRTYDPEVFLAKPQSADAAKTYLAPLRPALERAYCDIAEEELLDARDAVGAEEVLLTLRAARGAERDSKRADMLRDAASQLALLFADEALQPELQTAFELADKNNDHAALSKVGLLCSRRGNYSAADLFLARGFELARQNFGERTVQSVSAGRDLASHFHVSSQQFKMLEHFESWIGFVLDEFPEQTRYNIASVQRWVAAAYSHNLRMSEARAVHDKIDEALGRGLLTYAGLSKAVFLAERGQMAQFVGDYAKAREHFDAAWAVYPDLRDHLNWAMLESWNAIALAVEGDFEAADQGFQACLDFFKTSDRFGPDHPQTILVLMDWAKARLRLGHIEAALPQTKTLLEYFAAHRHISQNSVWELTASNLRVTALAKTGDMAQAEKLWNAYMEGPSRQAAQRNIEFHPEPRLFAIQALLSIGAFDRARALLSGLDEAFPSELLPGHWFRTMLADLKAQLPDPTGARADDIPAQIS